MPGLAVHRTTQAGAARLAGSGRYRAVICGLGGRVALPGQLRRRPLRAASRSCCGPRSGRIRARRPTRCRCLPTRHLYRHADAVMTYGDSREPPRGALPRARAARCSWRRRPWTWTTSPRPSAREARRAARASAGAGDGAAGAVRGSPRGGEGRATCCSKRGGRAGLGEGARLALAGRGPARAGSEDTAAGRPGPWLRWPLRAAGALRRRRHARRAVHPNRNFHRAVGVGRERGHVAEHTGDSQRRRGRRRRRARARRPNGAGVPGGGRRGAGRPHRDRWPGHRSCASDSARPGATPPASSRREAWARGRPVRSRASERRDESARPTSPEELLACRGWFRAWFAHEGLFARTWKFFV